MKYHCSIFQRLPVVAQGSQFSCCKLTYNALSQVKPGFQPRKNLVEPESPVGLLWLHPSHLLVPRLGGRMAGILLVFAAPL